MANIPATMVKELRDKTGAGMMDCKDALGETSGDIEAAVDWLRKKGLAKAAKKAGRIAADGLIGVAVEKTKGVLVEVNSETDFVARNDLFQGLVKMIAQKALDVGADVEKIKAAKVGSITIAEAIADTIAKIGENMTLAPRGELVGQHGRDRAATCTMRCPTTLARSASWSRSNRPARRTQLTAFGPYGRDACCCRQPARGRFREPRSSGGASARRTSWRTSPRRRASRRT